VALQQQHQHFPRWLIRAGLRNKTSQMYFLIVLTLIESKTMIEIEPVEKRLIPTRHGSHLKRAEKQP
jgi:hypothetical protein